MTDQASPPDGAGFVRGIGPFAAIAMVVGTMIGSGIFIVSADIARQTLAWGPAALLLVWLLTGVMTVAGALSYAELAAMMPRAGGQYVFLREGLSPLAGFLYGWTLFMVIQTGTIAAVAVAFGKFLGVLLPAVTPEVTLSFGTLPMPGGPIELGLSRQRLVALALVAFLTLVNLRGVRLGARVQTAFAVAKVGGIAVLVLLGFLGIGLAGAGAWEGNLAGFTGTAPWTVALLPVIGAAMVGALFSADAWNNVTFAAAEVRQPERNLPLALFAGTLIVCGTYLLVNLAYLRVLPLGGDPAAVDAVGRGIAHAAEDRVGTAAAEVLLGPVGGVLMALAIMVSTFGCVNGLVLAGPRVYYAMARDGLFFRGAGQLHARYQTPVVALLAQAAWAMLLCVSGSYGNLLDYVVVAALLFYALTIVALFRLRATQPALPRPVRAPGYPVLPGLYCLATAGLVVLLLVEKPLYTSLGLLVVGLGVPVYLAWRPRRG